MCVVHLVYYCMCLFGGFCVIVCALTVYSNVVCLVYSDVLCVYICEYYSEMCVRGCCVSCVLDYLCM